MKVAVMQPYFLPYIGYFQLIAAADRFVVYDDIKYTKKGWINRNRFLRDGRDEVFTVPLEAAPDTSLVRERRVSPSFAPEALLNRLREAYRRAPFFAPAFALVESIVRSPETNLFSFLLQSLRRTCAHLGIDTPLVVSSSLAVDAGLRGEERVIATCRAAGARTYVNPPGGRELYSPARFAESGLELRFLEPGPVEYPQFGAAFVPWLSIVDVMMFNSPERIRGFLDHGYRLD